MKKLRSLILCGGLLLASVAFSPLPLFLVGCQTTGTSQTSVADQADKSILSAFVIVDSFIRWEAANRSVAGPSVTAVADDIRRTAPDLFRLARSVVRAYRTDPSPEQLSLVNDYVAKVATIASTATAAHPSK